MRRITGMVDAVCVGDPLLSGGDPLFRVEVPDAATRQIDRIGWCEGGGGS